MKIRDGFVSNSSSSSFFLRKKNLTKEQIDGIHNHIKIAEKLAIERNIEKDRYGYDFYGCLSSMCRWDIKEATSFIYCSTSMNNFDLDEFIIKELGINEDDIYDKQTESYDCYSDNDLDRLDNQIILEETQNKINKIKSQ